MQHDDVRPAATVYLTAHVSNRGRGPRRTKAGTTTGDTRSYCWRIRLQRWTPEEVKAIIIGTFQTIADAEAKQLATHDHNHQQEV
jgi:hypothetical protein